MYGRNGTDQLNLGLLVLYVVLVVLQAILAVLFPFELISTFFSALLLLTAFFILFRTFSRNLDAQAPRLAGLAQPRPGQGPQIFQMPQLRRPLPRPQGEGAH